jgi:hypothetical protein
MVDRLRSTDNGSTGGDGTPPGGNGNGGGSAGGNGQSGIVN